MISLERVIQGSAFALNNCITRWAYFTLRFFLFYLGCLEMSELNVQLRYFSLAYAFGLIISILSFIFINFILLIKAKWRLLNILPPSHPRVCELLREVQSSNRPICFGFESVLPDDSCGFCNRCGKCSKLPFHILKCKKKKATWKISLNAFHTKDY